MVPISDSQRSQSKPFVTVLIIALNIFIFLFELSLDPFSRNEFVYSFGFVAAHFGLIPMVTSMFLHAGWMHLLWNMLFLWVFGDNVEDILGHGLFAVFYLLCGIAAALAQFAMQPDARVPMVGASGAIAGVMGAYLLKFPHARIALAGWFLFLYTIELPAWVVLIIWFASQFFSGVGSISQVHAQRGGTAFFAHVGGFLAGMALIKLLPTRDPYRQRRELLW